MLQPQVTLMCSTADTGEPTGKCVHPLAAARLKREPVWQNGLREFASPTLHLSPFSRLVNAEISEYPKKKITHFIFKVCPEKYLCISCCSLNSNWFRQGQAASSQHEPVSRLWQIHGNSFLQLEFIGSLHYLIYTITEISSSHKYSVAMGCEV